MDHKQIVGLTGTMCHYKIHRYNSLICRCTIIIICSLSIFCLHYIYNWSFVVSFKDRYTFIVDVHTWIMNKL